MLAQGVSKGATGGHLVFDLIHQVTHGLLLQAVGGNIERLQQRYAGFHHGGHLPSEQGNVQRGYLSPNHVKGEVFFRHPSDHDALFSKLQLDLIGAEALHLPFCLATVFIFPPPDVGGCFVLFSSHYVRNP